jgi:energy-converting hydrogenase A subunit M
VPIPEIKDWCNIDCAHCEAIYDYAIEDAKRTSVPFEDQKKMKLTLINEGKDITPGSFTFLEFDGEVKIVDIEVDDSGSYKHTKTIEVARLVPAVPKEEKNSQDILKFLTGEEPYDSLWFGDEPRDRRGKFWWRTPLRELVESLRKENEELKKVMNTKPDYYSLIFVHDRAEKAEKLIEYYRNENRLSQIKIEHLTEELKIARDRLWKNYKLESELALSKEATEAAVKGLNQALKEKNELWNLLYH